MRHSTRVSTSHESSISTSHESSIMKSITLWLSMTGPIRALLLLLLVACAVPATETTREYGVEIFAEDTITARITVSVTGDLQIALRGDNFQVMPDKSFIVTTPARLVATRGVGTATITSVDSSRRLAIVPLGTPDDSLDAATVTGTLVKFTRLGYERGKVRLEVERP